jgi:hypothetical protein
MDGMIGRAQLRRCCQFYYWVNFILRFSLLECSLPVPLQFSQKLLAHNVPGALSGVKMLHAFSVPTLDSATYSCIPCVKTGVCRLTPDLCNWKFVLVLCLWSWQSMRSTVSCRAINGKLSTMWVDTPRHSTSFAAVMAVWCATVSPQWRHIRTTSESGRGYVDDVTLLWWRHVDTNEVRVVGRIDAIQLKTLPKASFWWFLKC